MFITVEDVEYCEVFSTVEDVRYYGRCSVMWRMFNTMEDVQYFGGCSVLWRMFSTMEDVQCFERRMFSNKADAQYCGLFSNVKDVQ